MGAACQLTDLRLIKGGECDRQKVVFVHSLKLNLKDQTTCKDPRVPAPGTQLIKQYKDETLTVTVLEDGFQYGDRVYKSLSAIARQVTGTQWNGYVFFGLRLRQEQVRAE